MTKGKHNRPRRSSFSFAHHVVPADGLVILPPDMSILVSKPHDEMIVNVTWPFRDKATISKKEIPSADTYRHLVGQLADYLSGVGSLFDLAHSGHELFLLMLPEGTRKHIAAKHADGLTLRIDVSSDDFSFPFGLLYTRDPAEVIDVRHFLGFQHMLSRLPKTNGFITEKPPELYDGVPRISYASHAPLTEAVRHEVPRLKRLAKTRKGFHSGEVVHLGAFDGARKGAAVAEFRLAIEQQSPHVLHLACHGLAGEGAEPGVFVIDNGLHVTTDNFKKRGYVFEKGPLVFLNACQMGYDSANGFHSFMDILFDMQARSVIAPECIIDSARASMFSSAFYKWFVRCHLPAADAIHAAKHERLERANDPIGLAYCLYGQPETYISPKGCRS